MSNPYCDCGGWTYLFWEVSRPSHYSDYETPTGDLWLCDRCQKILSRTVVCTKYDMTGDHDEYETVTCVVERGKFLGSLGIATPFVAGGDLASSLSVRWEAGQYPERRAHALGVFVDEVQVYATEVLPPQPAREFRCPVPAGRHFIRVEALFRAQSTAAVETAAPTPALRPCSLYSLRYATVMDFGAGATADLRLASDCEPCGIVDRWSMRRAY